MVRNKKQGSRGKRNAGWRNALRSLLVAGLILFPVAGSWAQDGAARSPGAKTFRISGTVVNEVNGEIVRDATVRVGKADSPDALQMATTAEDGGFSFRGLEAGKYWLQAEGRGFATQAFEEHGRFSTAIVTGRDIDTEHLMFALHPDASISGVITDEAGEAVRDAQVMLFYRDTSRGKEQIPLRANGSVNDEGRYHFGHLPAGTYFVAVRAQPWYAQSVAAETGKAVASSGENGKETETSEAQEGAAKDGSGGSALDVTYAVTFYAGATEESGATPLVLRAGDRATADVRLTPVPALHLRVPHPGNDPSEPFAVLVQQKIFDGPEMPAPTQNRQLEKGALDVSGIAPGEYEIHVQTFGNSPQGWSKHAVIKSDTELASEESPSSAQVKGIIKSTGNAPLQKGGVQLWNRANGETFSALISEKGEFDFSTPTIPAGTYEVSLGSSNGERVSSIAASGAKVRGHNIEISGQGAVQLTINVTSGLGRIDGTALRNGKPASGMMVLLLPRDAENNLPLVRRDQSDLDGTFSLRSVVPGSYRVLVLRNGWDQDWSSPEAVNGWWKTGKPVEISAGRTVEVRVEAQ